MDRSLLAAALLLAAVFFVTVSTAFGPSVDDSTDAAGLDDTRQDG